MEAAAEKSRSATVLDLQAETYYNLYEEYQLGEPTIRSACSPRMVSAWLAFLMLFLPFVYEYPSSCPCAHCTPTKACLLCATPPGMDLYIQVHACRHLPSAVPWISEGCLFNIWQSPRPACQSITKTHLEVVRILGIILIDLLTEEGDWISDKQVSQMTSQLLVHTWRVKSRMKSDDPWI